MLVENLLVCAENGFFLIWTILIRDINPKTLLAAFGCIADRRKALTKLTPANI
jgi:hypothetical protein